MASEESITLRAMRFHSRIGVLPHESELPQPLEIDVTVWRAARTHAALPEDVLDYRTLYDMAAGAATPSHVRYLEEVADAIVEAALRNATVERVRVAVRKPHVSLPGPLAYAEVSVERERRG